MRSSILTYHSLDDSGSAISTSPQLFRAHVARLAASSVPVVRLDQVRTVPGSVALTFDGGFRNFLDHGLPVLEEFGYPATVFVVTGYCGDRNRWDNHRRDIPKLPLMDWDQLAWLPRATVTLGAQTVHHPVLPRMTEKGVIRELDQCSAGIRHLTGASPTCFAYPFGAVSDLVKRLVAGRFALACGGRPDHVTAESDAWELPRIDASYLKDAELLMEAGKGNRPWQMGIQRLFREVRARLRSA